MSVVLVGETESIQIKKYRGVAYWWEKGVVRCLGVTFPNETRARDFIRIFVNI